MRWNLSLSLIACIALLGCGSLPKVSGSRLPYQTDAVRVESATERGDVLDVEFSLAGGDALRGYFPADDGCRALLAPGAELEWSRGGALGFVRSAGSQCDAIGTATFWPLIEARPPLRTAKPRATARWEPLYADADVLMVRGLFPLYAAVLGIPGDDITTVLPATPPCPEIADLGEAAMEYDTRSKQFSLLRGGDRCDIRGIIQQR